MLISTGVVNAYANHPRPRRRYIDWFVKDSYGHILHLASGSILPEPMVASQEVL